MSVSEKHMQREQHGGSAKQQSLPLTFKAA